MAVTSAVDTIPALFFASEGRQGPDAHVQWFEDGQLRSMPWAESVDTVRELSAGLMRLGLSHGDRVALIAATSHVWTACDLAILCSAGVTVGIYPTSTEQEVVWTINDCGARIAFVDTEERAHQLQNLAPEHAPSLRHIIVMGGASGDHVHAEGIMLLEELVAGHRATCPDGRAALDARWRSVGEDDLATLVYTSGTTGVPKGVELTHRNLVHNARAATDLLPIGSDDVSIIYLPLAHVLQRVTLYAGLVAGGLGVYAESLTSLPDHLQEVRPTILAGVPRVFEKIHAKVLSRVQARPEVVQRLFGWALGVGHRYAECLRYRRPIPVTLRARHRLADTLVLSRVREGLGGRVRYMVSGAAPIALETLHFFHACGLPIYEGYGLTETAAPVTMNTPTAYRFGTVGRPVPSSELTIAEDGEVLVRGPMVFRGYWGRPDANAAAFVEDESGRWFCTGDIGEVDSSGFLRITDRKKNIIVTAGGKNIAPQPIENALRQHPLVEHACVIGDRRKYLVAVMTLEPEELKEWIRSHGMRESDHSAHVAHPSVRATLEGHVDAVNDGLASYQTIKRFIALPEGFSVETGTLTPTMKLRRSQIAEHFSAAIGALYEDA